MGIKYLHRSDKWDIDLAFFKNAEELRFGNKSDLSDSRYSYDISSIDLGNGKILRNKETNQLNGKVLYKFGTEKMKHKLGFSAEYGGLYNLDTENMGSHSAVAAHYQLDAGRVALKLQATNYNNNASNPTGQPTDVIAMTAYGAPYLVASKGIVYTIGVAYTLPVKWGVISSLQFYNDFGLLDKSGAYLSNTLMNVAGVLVTAGQIYTYIDVASGQNQPWLGETWTDALGNGHLPTVWETRFNINLGYYF